MPSPFPELHNSQIILTWGEVTEPELTLPLCELWVLGSRDLDPDPDTEEKGLEKLLPALAL